MLTVSEINAFQKTVLDFYKKHKRKLPFRFTEKTAQAHAYHILISEYMLQQTQVDRVVQKYLEFIDKFPSMQDLARATTKDVLTLWSGLGYNRRALYLQSTVKNILDNYGGVIPRDPKTLKTLPGIGEYMSQILPVFIYNDRHVLVETNIRTVFLYHFFYKSTSVTDKEILELVAQTLPTKDIREWYYALMDYGAYLKKTHNFQNTASKSYAKQAPFKNSQRFLRGQIIKLLLESKCSVQELIKRFSEYAPEHIEQVLTQLQSEKLIIKKGGSYCI